MWRWERSVWTTLNNDVTWALNEHPVFFLILVLVLSVGSCSMLGPCKR